MTHRGARSAAQAADCLPGIPQAPVLRVVSRAQLCVCTPGTGEVERRRPDLHGPQLHSEARLDDETSLFPKRNNEEEEKEERSMAHLGDREHIYLLGADNALQQKKR